MSIIKWSTAVILVTLLSSCQIPTSPDDDDDGVGTLQLSRDALVFNAGGDLPSDTRTLTLTNTGDAALTISEISTTNAAFSVQTAAPLTLEADSSAELPVTFTPASSPGPQSASLSLTSSEGTASVYLGGLTVVGQEGTKEPSVQWIFDTFGYPIETGDPNPADSAIAPEVTTDLIGEEVAAQTFVRADPSQPVTLEVLAAFGVADVAPVYRYGIYAAGSATPPLTELLAIPITPTLNGQKLEPVFTSSATAQNGVLSFEPPADTFGFYSYWPTTDFFDERTVYTEDALNTFPGAGPHQVRTFPLKDRNNGAVANAYILVTDESIRLNDFNDAVVLVRNVQPVSQ